MEKEEKKKRVKRFIDVGDILSLRQLAIERWGLVDNDARKEIWPKIYGIERCNIPEKPGEFINYWSSLLIVARLRTSFLKFELHYIHNQFMTLMCNIDRRC